PPLLLEGERGAVMAQPGALLAPGRPAALEQRPEARRVVEDLQVADLVPDDVVEHPLGREQQPPVEAHAPVGRARRPARALAAYLKVAIWPARQRAGVVEARLDLRARRASVETLQRRARIPRGHEQPIATAMRAGAPPLRDKCQGGAQI